MVSAGLNLKDDAGHADGERKVDQAEYQSVLGFYKERRRDEVALEVQKEGGSYFVEIPSHLRNRLEIVVGSRLRGFVHQIRRRDQGSGIRGQLAEVGGLGTVNCQLPTAIDWEIVGYWHELGIPEGFVERFRLRQGDFLEIAFESVVNYGEEKAS
ncbi:hypothetical protein M1O56_05495 [Dehalococcoidia bacterium]|nr:hypothetical protein [Dehalococcoidia bacterium]